MSKHSPQPDKTATLCNNLTLGVVARLMLLAIIELITPILAFPLSGGRDKTRCEAFVLRLRRTLCTLPMPFSKAGIIQSCL